MHNQTTWVLVANTSHAKIFRMVHFPRVEPLLAMEHPESRLHNQDLISSKPGRSFERAGTTRHAYEPKTDAKHLEIDKFAKEIGNYLSSAREKREFARLYVIASPEFLGVLRPHIDPQTEGTIVAEVAKDLAEHSQGEIEQHLAEL